MALLWGANSFVGCLSRAVDISLACGNSDDKVGGVHVPLREHHAFSV